MSPEVAAFVQSAIDAYKEVITSAVPIAAIIGMCNIGINILYSAFIGKRLHLGGD